MVDEIEESQTPIVRSRPRITLRETIMQNLEINELDKNIIFDRTLISFDSCSRPIKLSSCCSLQSY